MQLSVFVGHTLYPQQMQAGAASEKVQQIRPTLSANPLPSRPGQSGMFRTAIYPASQAARLTNPIVVVRDIGDDVKSR